MQTPILIHTPLKLPTLKKWVCHLPKKYVIATLSGKNLLAVDIKLESTETLVKHCTQALINCSAKGCCLDTKWVRTNDIPTCLFTRLILVFNVDGTPNLAGSIMHIVDMILRYADMILHYADMILHYAGVMARLLPLSFTFALILFLPLLVQHEAHACSLLGHFRLSPFPH